MNHHFDFWNFIFGLLVGGTFGAIYAYYIVRTGKLESVTEFLVDLEQYEKNLLFARERDRRPIPLRPLPGSFTPSLKDKELLEQNRRRAKKIFERIFPNLNPSEYGFYKDW